MDNERHSHWKNFNYDRSDRMKKDLIPMDKVMNVLEPKPEDTVVDAACGSGYFTLAIAPLVKTVISIDANATGLDTLRNRLIQMGTANVTVIQEDLCNFVPEAGNKIFLANAYHDLDCRHDLISKYSAALDGPDFILIEFKKNAVMGPPAEIKISESELEDIFSRHSYSLKASEELQMHYVHRYSRN